MSVTLFAAHSRDQGNFPDHHRIVQVDTGIAAYGYHETVRGKEG